MSGRAISVDSRKGTQQQDAYTTSWEHLADELKRLDLLIHLRLKQRQPAPPGPLDQFKGLVLDEEEVTHLLNAPADTPPAGDREQLALAEELDRLSARIDERREASLREGVYLALPHLSHLFHLTPFEEHCVLICLAPEMDGKYERLYAYLHDDVTRKRPSPALALSLLCKTAAEKVAARSVFLSQAPLLKYRLWQVIDGPHEASAPLMSRALKLEDRVVNFLTGIPCMDARLMNAARLIAHGPGERHLPAYEELRGQLHRFVESQLGQQQPARHSLVFHLHGQRGAGRRALAVETSHRLSLPLLVGDVERMMSGPLPFEEMVWLFGREAVLGRAALCLENIDSLVAEQDKHMPQMEAFWQAASCFSRLTFLLGNRRWQPRGVPDELKFFSLEFRTPDARASRQLWQRCASNQYRVAPDVDWAVLASKFRFQPEQIKDVLAMAHNRAVWRSPGDGLITMSDLHAACCAQASPRLAALTRKVEPLYRWKDIVLPEDQVAQLRDMCEQVKHQSVVYGDWGFERKLSLGKGVAALFSGPPGTGKTMAAEVIANELQLDLYKVDLSQVVSKYIGETEKNLNHIFSEAQASNAILFFDEADALFGKRSEVKDAHDRYANIEVGYLLQKMEEYEGITILATNLRQHLDEAFTRRMRFVIEFPFPDEEYRRRIWEVTFPHEAPLGGDVSYETLAREIKLAGGNIKNIGLAAAFYAAADGGLISMPHLIQAARREFQKLGRTWDEVAFNAKSESVS
jgi:hypothetical protein